MLQESLGDSGDARIARFSPRLHARAHLIDQRDRHEDSRVVESLGALRRNDVTRRSPAVFLVEGTALAVVTPITRRFVKRRVDGEVIDGGLSHYCQGSILYFAHRNHIIQLEHTTPAAGPKRVRLPFSDGTCQWNIHQTGIVKSCQNGLHQTSSDFVLFQADGSHTTNEDCIIL